MHILLVDRPGAPRSTTANWLRMLKSGQVVDVVDSGAEALEFLGNGNPRPQLVLVDSQLADMSAFDFVRRIKARSPAPQVVMIARVVTQRLLAAARAAGADHGIEKSQLQNELPALLPPIDPPTRQV